MWCHIIQMDHVMLVAVGSYLSSCGGGGILLKIWGKFNDTMTFVISSLLCLDY